MRVFRVILLLVVSVVALTACGPVSFVCSAIGYSSVAHVQLDHPKADLHLELCDGVDCAGQGPASSSPEPARETAPLSASSMQMTGNSSDGWTAQILGGHSTPLGYRLTDSTGAVVAEGSVDVEWVRIDGSDRCGGNRVAEVTLPSS